MAPRATPRFKEPSVAEKIIVRCILDGGQLFRLLHGFLDPNPREENSRDPVSPRRCSHIIGSYENAVDELERSLDAKSICLSCRGLGFWSQHTHGNSQPSVTLVSGYLFSFFGFETLFLCITVLTVLEIIL